jgi:acyl-CoA thioester hydrolase
MVAAFEPAGVLLPLRVLPPALKPLQNGRRFRATRTVQRYELDWWGHVNHANYLRWIEQIIFSSLAEVGFPVSRMLAEGWLIYNLGHEIEYFQPALDGDELEITAWVSHVGQVRGAWTIEIRNKRTDALLARDVTPGGFVTLNGQPKPIPHSLVAALTSEGGEG